jgi:hypothetical protein
MSDPHHQEAEQEKGSIGLAKLEGNGREGSESRLPNLRAGEERTELLPSRIAEDEVFWEKEGKVKMCKWPSPPTGFGWEAGEGGGGGKTHLLKFPC